MDFGERHRNRKGWKWAVVVLCATGFLKGFSTSAGPFFAGYASTADHPSFTMNQLMDYLILSFGLSVLILIILTDALNYRPVIVVGCLFPIVGWILYIWLNDNFTAANLRPWFRGAELATTELAYTTYTYGILDYTPDYRRITGLTTAALWMGEALAKIILHLFSSSLSPSEWNYLFLGASVTGALISLALPKVLDPIPPDPSTVLRPPPRSNQVTYSTPTSVDPKDTLANLQAPSDAWYFKFRNRRDGPGQKSFIQKMKESPSQTKLNFVAAYNNKIVIRWSVWVVLGFGLFLQVEAAFIWTWSNGGGIKGSNGFLLQSMGALIPAVLGAWLGGGICGCGWTNVLRRRSWGFGLLGGGGTLIQGVALFVLQSTYGKGGGGDSSYWIWGCYIIYRTVFLVLAIIAKSTIAEEIRERSAAFIFGINTFVSVIIYAGLKLIITVWLNLGVREHTLFLAWFATILGLCFALFGIWPILVTSFHRWQNGDGFCKRERTL